jgi:hypothetical protein
MIYRVKEKYSTYKECYRYTIQVKRFRIWFTIPTERSIKNWITRNFIEFGNLEYALDYIKDRKKREKLSKKEAKYFYYEDEEKKKQLLDL